MQQNINAVATSFLSYTISKFHFNLIMLIFHTESHLITKFTVLLEHICAFVCVRYLTVTLSAGTKKVQPFA